MTRRVMSVSCGGCRGGMQGGSRLSGRLAVWRRWCAALLLMAAAMASAPALAATALKPAMLYGKWQVTKVDTDVHDTDALQTFPVIRDVELRSDGTYLTHWGLGAVQAQGRKLARSEGSWGMPTPSQVALCANTKSKCDDPGFCIRFMFVPSAQCLDVLEYGGDRMRVREPGPGHTVIEYQMVRPSANGGGAGASAGPKGGPADSPHDFADQALAEFRSASGIELTGVRDAYRQTLAALRGARAPHSREYAEMYLVWYYQAFQRRQEGAKPPPVVTSPPDTEAFRVQMARLRYMLDISGWLRGRQGNAIYASYGRVVAEAGATFVAERKAGRERDFNAVLEQVVNRHYGVRVDPAGARASIADSRLACDSVGGRFDALAGKCRTEPVRAAPSPRN